ncbi:MAG: hypothetical protein KKI08_14485 [Armatimonadetes bacterium]|nr:hypothetical protein [Armatimonadota bacterium]
MSIVLQLRSPAGVVPAQVLSGALQGAQGAIKNLNSCHDDQAWEQARDELEALQDFVQQRLRLLFGQDG